MTGVEEPPLVAAVAIGRNEGQRLHACLESLRAQFEHIVYVDSGSADGSPAYARGLGIDVVELSRDRGFTAARARNAGFERITRSLPGLRYVQFIDGDCELTAGWLPAAVEALEAEPGVAAVCGRRRERSPQASPYNRLCDIEWDTPVGVAPVIGGDALVRASAFAEVGGFDPALIAGEEPDLCHKLRKAGWTLRRLDSEMTLHDAALLRFGQWWQRNRRSGYAMAEGLARRREGWRKVASNLLWALPLSWPLWPLLWGRAASHRGATYATFITLGKLPHCQGQIEYWLTRRSLIEYK